jgi:hypothetical protein
MEELSQFIERALDHTDRAMTYMVSRRLADLHEGQAVLEVYHAFDIDGFLRYGNGDARLAKRLSQQQVVRWQPEDRSVDRELLVSLVEVDWEGERFQVLRAPLQQCGAVHWVVGPDGAIDRFVRAVLGYSNRRSPATHVYAGWWHESEPLDRAIQAARWDDLVLPAPLARTIEMHTCGFFDAEADFHGLGLSWKRGLLLTGPPGNGKTFLIRAILNRLPVPRLIVKSFGDDPDDVQEVFDKVRELSPCVLVLEDLDSLVPKGLLSSVLNSLDGAEPLNGVLVLATTNHPERLDPAIRNRPSRFDRVIDFGPPARPERAELLRRLLSRAPREARLSRRQVEALAEATEGFSYAYLKELAISAVVSWAQERRPRALYGIAQGLVVELRAQMEAQSQDDEDE